MQGVADTVDRTTQPVPPSRRVTDRERFLTFALAAAEILVEVTPEGRIGFAAGALQSRFGTSPECWVGRKVRDLVALADRRAFDRAFNSLLLRDRLRPTTLRLADTRATPMTFAGLRLPMGDTPLLCVTISALPGEVVLPGGAEEAPAGPDVLRDAAEDAARDPGFAGCLEVIELRTEAGAPLPDAVLRETLRDGIATALPADAAAGELGEGRFGVISRASVGLAKIGAHLAEMARDAGVAASIDTRKIPLTAEGLTPVQATRALRYALNSFARDGIAAIDAGGFIEGLQGFVDTACDRALRLRQAIAGNRFRLAFQPIVRLADRRVHHYEALIRPDGGDDSDLNRPQDFVTFAETIGLSESLDWAVLVAACSAARGAGDVQLAVNLSGLSLQSPSFRARMVNLLAAEPLLARRLLVEITETAEIEDEAEAIATVEALRERGLALCIDDFGAGAAAFRYLRAFRVDYVKIDGQYVMNATRSGQDRGIVAGMVDLARTVGARVVAERIETDEEAALMQGLGVEYGQGWLFGRPGPLPGR